MFKSGFVSVVGRPNSGKSTLINYIMGQKVVITSDKPQTTRNKINCIYNGDNCQIIFIDTPGVHKPKHKLGQLMLNKVEQSLNEMDALLLVVDASVPFGKGEQFICERLQRVNTPIIQIMNKIDLVDLESAEEKAAKFTTQISLQETFYISALKGTNVDSLVARLEELMPEGPQYYPEDQYIDQPEKFIVAELIREKLLKYTDQEIPHSLAVEITYFSKRPNKDLIDIEGILYVERESQKKIVIGKNGKLLKKVGKEAREDIENLLGSQVFLDLWVKTKKDWRNKDRILKELGYRGYE